jgi:hypothetical protein
MRYTIQGLALALALCSSLGGSAYAGGSTAMVEGPMKDATYLVRTAHCGEPASMTVTATAEGVVKGQRKSLPIKLTSTKEKGVYQFARTWPSDGSWIVRVTPSARDRAVTLVTIASDGSVGNNEFVWKSDGRHECDQKLAANTK